MDLESAVAVVVVTEDVTVTVVLVLVLIVLESASALFENDTDCPQRNPRTETSAIQKMARDKGTLEDALVVCSLLPPMLLNPLLLLLLLLLFVLFVCVVLLLNPLLLVSDDDRLDLALIICRMPSRIPMTKSSNPKQIEPSSRRKRSRNGLKVPTVVASVDSVAVAVAVAASSDIVPI